METSPANVLVEAHHGPENVRSEVKNGICGDSYELVISYVICAYVIPVLHHLIVVYCVAI